MAEKEPYFNAIFLLRSLIPQTISKKLKREERYVFVMNRKKKSFIKFSKLKGYPTVLVRLN